METLKTSCDSSCIILLLGIICFFGCSSNGVTHDKTLREIGISKKDYKETSVSKTVASNHIGPCLEEVDINSDEKIDMMTFYIYDPNNRIIDKKTVRTDDNLLQIEHSYKYDNKGNIVEERIIEGNVETHIVQIYQGKFKHRTIIETNASGQKNVSETQIFDENGSMVRVEKKINGEIVTIEKYDFNDHGNWTKRSIDTLNQIEDDAICKYWTKDYKYNQQGHIISEKTDNYGDGKPDECVYKDYDLEGKILTETYSNCSEKNIFLKIKYAYNKNGKCTSVIKNGIVNSEWIYNDIGHLEKELHYDVSGNRDFESIYFYDDNGNLLKNIVWDNSGYKWLKGKHTISYFYNCASKK